MGVDLHVHTTASDGTSTPEEVVRLAARIGLKAIGIADHDTTEGIAPALAEAKKNGVEIVLGVEINTEYDGTEVHVLGYYFDNENKKFLSQLAFLREARFERIKKIVAKLQELGYKISLDRVMELAGSGSVGRPHVSLALQEAGAVSSTREAFEKLLGSGRPAFVPRYKIDPQDAVKMIIEAKGVPVLAHPGVVGRDKLIPELISAGLMGLEAYHSDHTAETARRYVALAQHYNLLVTGGSDYHGEHKLHAGLGSVYVSYEAVEKLKEARASLEKL